MTEGDELRGLMRRWPHGVSILSVDVDGDRMGVTVSSLVSLSLEPPLVGVSIGKEASCYELLRRAGRFAVSLLGSEQEELARRFASGFPPTVPRRGGRAPGPVSPQVSRVSPGGGEGRGGGAGSRPSPTALWAGSRPRRGSRP